MQFFKKIRRRLLRNGSFSRYFQYAIGEILLVVVGILIALSINNWNEERKERQVEREMLEELKSGLEGDLADITINVVAHKRYLNSQNKIVDWLNRPGQELNDSLYNHFAQSTNSTFFLFNEGPYETIKQMGMRVVTNKTLRLRIQRLYDMVIKDYIEANKTYTKIQEKLIFDYGPRLFNDEDIFFMIPGDVEKLRQDKEYVYMLKTIRNYNMFFLENKIIPAQKEVTEVISLIEEELTRTE